MLPRYAQISVKLFQKKPCLQTSCLLLDTLYCSGTVDNKTFSSWNWPIEDFQVAVVSWWNPKLIRS